MSSKSPVRSCDDVDETALSYSEIKAVCAGNPLIAEKMALDNDVAKLRMLRAEHRSQHYRLEDSLLKTFPQQIKSVTERIDGAEKDIAAYAAQKELCHDMKLADGAASASARFPGMVVNGVAHAEKEPAGKALLEACKGATDKSERAIGEYMGFKMSLSFDSFSKQFKLWLRGNLTYQLDLGTDAFGNITRINNALDDLPKRLDGMRSQLADCNKQMAAAKEELAMPFPQEAELADKEARLALLNADLNIDGDGGFDVLNDDENRGEPDGGQRHRGDTRDDNSYGDEQDECDDPLPRADAYGRTAKSAPSFLDNIRSMGSRRQENPAPSGKSAGIEI
jgi:hypothetical protein